MENKVFCGDAAEILKSLPQGSANMCVTSPPYYGLRDYGIENQIGTEQTPQEYVDRLIKVFDEVYRVLMDDGTLWLNIGDSYAGSGKGKGLLQEDNVKDRPIYDKESKVFSMPNRWENIKPKDLIGIPWMLAFALRERGWLSARKIAEILLRLQGNSRTYQRGNGGTIYSRQIG